MASSKCNVVEGVETQEDDLTKATDLHDQEVDAVFGIAPDGDNWWLRFNQALNDKAERMFDGLMNMGNLGSNGTINEKIVQKILDKQFKLNDKDNAMRAKLISQIQAVIRNDEDLLSVYKEKVFELTRGLNYQELRNKGINISIDPLTGLPRLYQLPLEMVNQVYGEMSPYMEKDENGNARGLYKGNIAYEFMLPKNVLVSFAKKKVTAFKDVLYKYHMNLNRMISSYNNPINISVDQEKILVHPGTDIPIIHSMRRNKSGLKDVYDNTITSFTSMLLADGSITKPDHVHQLITDLMTGKAFIRKDKEGFGKVYMFQSEAPVGEYESSGDTIFKWKGKNFTQAELVRLREKSSDFTATEYVVPYQIVDQDKYFGRETMETILPPIDLGDRIMETSNGPLPAATILDSALQHIDTILLEVGMDMQEGFVKAQKRFNEITKDFKAKGIDLPTSIFGELSTELDALEDYNNEFNSQKDNINNWEFVNNKGQTIRLKDRKQYDDRFALEDGTMVVGQVYKRYFPRMYYPHRLGEAIASGLQNINEQIEALKVDIAPDQSGMTEAQSAKRNQSFKRLGRLLKARGHLEQALSKFDESEGSQFKEEETPDVLRPFEKHFKSLSGFIRYENVRKDSSVVFDYIQRVNRNLIRSNTMLSMLEAYGEVETEGQRNYIVNQYRKAFGSINAEGSIAGIRFTMKDFSKLFPGYSPRQIRKFVNAMRSLQTFNSLGGWTTGPANMAAMVNKFMEVGYDKALKGYYDQFLEENKELIISSGILSFQDIVETHVLQSDNPQQIKDYKILKAKYKRDIKNASTNAEADLARGLLKMIKKDSSQWASVTRNLANYAITGQFNHIPGESASRSIVKSVLGLRRFVSMSLTEKIVRSTSFMIGVNQAIESGAASSKFDPVATKWGQEFVNQLDFTLGNEGVGDMLGNDIMNWFHQIRVWSTQRSSYGFHAYKRMWMSKYNYASEDLEAIKQGKAGFDFVKALLTTIMGPFLKPISTVGGGLALAGAVGGTAPVLAVAGITGGALGYLGAKGVHQMTNIQERNKAMRLLNPNKAKGAQMLIFHGAFSALYDFVLFNSSFGVLQAGGIASMVNTMRKAAFGSGVNKVGPAFTSPLLRASFASMHLLYKALSDEEEIEKHDMLKLFGSYAGLGAMQIMYALLSSFDEEHGYHEGRYQQQRDYKRQLVNFYFTRSVPYFDAYELGEGVKGMAEYTGELFERGILLGDIKRAKFPTE